MCICICEDWCNEPGWPDPDPIAICLGARAALEHSSACLG